MKSIIAAFGIVIIALAPAAVEAGKGGTGSGSNGGGNAVGGGNTGQGANGPGQSGNGGNNGGGTGTGTGNSGNQGNGGGNGVGGGNGGHGHGHGGGGGGGGCGSDCGGGGGKGSGATVTVGTSVSGTGDIIRTYTGKLLKFGERKAERGLTAQQVWTYDAIRACKNDYVIANVSGISENGGFRFGWYGVNYNGLIFMRCMKDLGFEFPSYGLVGDFDGTVSNQPAADQRQNP